MIKAFRHKGLKQLFQKGDPKGVSQNPKRVGRLLDALNGAEGPAALKLPGFNTHELKGDRKGTWSMTVTGNWRITFKFKGADAVEVDLEDYH